VSGKPKNEAIESLLNRFYQSGTEQEKMLSESAIGKVRDRAKCHFDISTPGIHLIRHYRFSFSAEKVFMAVNKSQYDGIPELYQFYEIPYTPAVGKEVARVCTRIAPEYQEQLNTHYKKEKQEKGDRLLKWALKNPHESGLEDDFNELNRFL